MTGLDSDFPILEYDECRECVTELAARPRNVVLPDRMVGCFQQWVIDDLVAKGRVRHIHSVRSNMGAHPVYELEAYGRTLGLFNPGLGAPLAVGFLEELAHLGASKFVICGTCGTLHGHYAKGTVVVPVSAVRDEGTSYHYLPPSREVKPDARVLAVVRSVLEERGCRYLLGKTWTTDAVFREARTRAQRRRAEGCLVVDMEASALFAAAQYRGLGLGVILSTTDNASGEEATAPEEPQPVYSFEEIFWHSLEACAAL